MSGIVVGVDGSGYARGERAVIVRQAAHDRHDRFTDDFFALLGLGYGLDFGDGGFPRIHLFLGDLVHPVEEGIRRLG